MTMISTAITMASDEAPETVFGCPPVIGRADGVRKYPAPIPAAGGD
jgi:hypothetical protein